MSSIEDRTVAIRGPLYNLLTAKLPSFCGEDGTLNVKRLHTACKISHEGVYKWLRSNRMTAAAVKKVVALSGGPPNRALLKARGIEPAKNEDFTTFLFA